MLLKEVPKKIEIVEFPWSCVPQGRYAHMYMALDKEYYEDEGLSVRMFSSKGTNLAATSIAEKKFDIKEATMDNTILLSSIHMISPARDVIQYIIHTHMRGLKTR